MLLWSRACDEQELSWCQLRDGDLSKDSPSGRQHVADISQAHLKTHRSKDTESERGMQSYRSLGLLLKEGRGTVRWCMHCNAHISGFQWWTINSRRRTMCVLYLGHGVSKQAVQQLVWVLPLHYELAKRRQVDHSHLLHHQLALSANWSEPVGASETGPEHSTKSTIALYLRLLL